MEKKSRELYSVHNNHDVWVTAFWIILIFFCFLIYIFRRMVNKLLGVAGNSLGVQRPRAPGLA